MKFKNTITVLYCLTKCIPGCGEDEGSCRKACGCHLRPGNDKAARGNELGKNQSQENLRGHFVTSYH